MLVLGLEQQETSKMSTRMVMCIRPMLDDYCDGTTKAYNQLFQS